MFSAGVSNSFDRFRIGDPHASSALDEWFNDDSSKFMGVSADHGHCGICPTWVVVARGAQYVESEWIKDVSTKPAGSDGDRSDRVAVVGPAKCEVAGSFCDSLVRPKLKRDLDCLFYGSCTI